MQAQHSAIGKLNDRIVQVLGYLRAIQDGQAAWDHEALRQIQTVVANLPNTVLPELQDEILRVSTTSKPEHLSLTSGSCLARPIST